jgi:hypothetical protein
MVTIPFKTKMRHKIFEEEIPSRAHKLIHLNSLEIKPWPISDDDFLNITFLTIQESIGSDQALEATSDRILGKNLRPLAIAPNLLKSVLPAE